MELGPQQKPLQMRLLLKFPGLRTSLCDSRLFFRFCLPLLFSVLIELQVAVILSITIR